MVYKICSTCKEDKPATEYHKQGDGLQSRCKKCNCSGRSKYYKDNRKKERDYDKRRRKDHQLKVREYLLIHPCVDCKESDPIVLEFDHIKDKEDCISNMVKRGLSWDRIKKEIDKCEVRCCNCHRRVTYKRAGLTQW